MHCSKNPQFLLTPRFNAKQIEVNMNIILLLEIVNRSIEEEDAGEGQIKATIDKQHN